MKTLLIFDSFFGNTETIARAIAKPFSSLDNFEIKRSNEVAPTDLSNYELIIAGSPTRGFNPTPDISNLLKAVGAKSLRNTKVATFDTRVALHTIKSGVLRKIVNTGGYAAKPLTKRLCKKGARAIVEPEGFYVLDTEGPLQEGELERAEQWGQSILAIVNQ